MKKRLILTEEDRKEMEAERLYTWKDRYLFTLRMKKWREEHPDDVPKENSVEINELSGYAYEAETLFKKYFPRFVEKYGIEEGNTVLERIKRAESPYQKTR